MTDSESLLGRLFVLCSLPYSVHHLAMLVDGPHFQATDEGELVFLLSDGDDNRRPTEHDIIEPEEESSTPRQNYYLRVPLDDPDSHRWRDEIAKYLAPLVLGSTYNSLATTRRISLRASLTVHFRTSSPTSKPLSYHSSTLPAILIPATTPYTSATIRS